MIGIRLHLEGNIKVVIKDLEGRNRILKYQEVTLRNACPSPVRIFPTVNKHITQWNEEAIIMAGDFNPVTDIHMDKSSKNIV